MKRTSFRLDAADAAMLVVVATWATNNIVIKLAVGLVPAITFVMARFLLVLALIWAWILIRRVPAGIAARDLLPMIFTGVTGYGIYSALFTIGMERTSAFSVALLVSTTPIFTLILARLRGIEYPIRAQWLAVGVSALGVAVFIGDKLASEGLGTAVAGDALGLLAAFSFAVYSLAVRSLTARYGASVTTGWGIVVGTAAIAPWGIPAVIHEPWQALPATFWVGLVYAAAVAMLVGYTLWSWAIARGGVTRTAPYLFLIPIVTGVISAIFLAETFTPWKLAGAMLVLAGTTLVRVTGRAAPLTASAEHKPERARTDQQSGLEIAAEGQSGL